MKNWKKFKKLPHLDIGSRDAPCLIYNNLYFQGNISDTHSIMLNREFLDFDTEEVSEDYKMEKWYREDLKKDFKDEEFIFGSVFRGCIYWEGYIPTKELKKKILQVKDLPKNLTHFINDGNDIKKIF